MKKSILITILSLFAFGAINGQAFMHTSPVSPNTVCVGAQVTMSFYVTGTGTVAPYGNYAVWFGPTIGTAAPITPTILTTSWHSISSQGTIVATVPSVPNGTYYMFVKHSSIAVGNSSNTTIYVLNIPTSTISSVGSNSICPSTSVQLTSTISSVGTYSWSNSQTTSTIAVNAPGNFYLKMTNVCGTTLSNTITITQIQTPTIAISGSTIGCGSVSLNAAASSYTAINWSNAQNGTVSIAMNSGNYYATAVNACGSVVSNTIAVVVNTVPVVSAVSSHSVLCSGFSSTLTASGANTYTWIAGPSTNVYTVSPTSNTTYTVIGESANTCTASTLFTQVVSICTGLDNKLFNDIINSVYPVPANDNLNIEFKNLNDNSSAIINVYSLDGRKILSQNFESNMNKITLNVSNLQNGYYILEVVSNTFKTTKNIIISR